MSDNKKETGAIVLGGVTALGVTGLLAAFDLPPTLAALAGLSAGGAAYYVQRPVPEEQQEPIVTEQPWYCTGLLSYANPNCDSGIPFKCRWGPLSYLADCPGLPGKKAVDNLTSLPGFLLNNLDKIVIGVAAVGALQIIATGRQAFG